MIVDKKIFIEIEKTKKSKISEIDFNNLEFGEVFTDHLLECDYKDGKWHTMKIKPYGPISLDPSAKIFHYGQAIFEGMKAYKDERDSIWLFRPDENQKRFNKSAVRLAMPELPKDFFFGGLETLLNLEKNWVRKENKSSLYIRPIMIGTECGISATPSKEYKFMILCSPAQSYYSGEISVLFADTYSRSASGGVGFIKCGGNYAGQFYPTKLANDIGYQQIIWTDSNTHENLEEAGTMNVFFRIGDKLITTPISDRILDGVTRKSVLTLAEDEGLDFDVRNVSVYEIEEAAKKRTLLEMFGTGTATVINPITAFGFRGNYYELPKIDNSYATMFKEKITGIQTKKNKDKFGWTYKVGPL